MKQKNCAAWVGSLLGTLWWCSVTAAYTPATTPSYIIGPGDVLRVFVWQNPDLSVTVPVRPDGKISTPLDEGMVAVGKTPSRLAQDIRMVDGREKDIRVRLGSLVNSGDMSQNLPLKPGDVLVVPESRF